jgi:peptidoglycan/LPS O-acetylase OafA/YrhL
VALTGLLSDLPAWRVLMWAELDIVRAYWLLLAVATAGAVAIAVALYYLFERLVTRGLRALVARLKHAAEAPVPVATRRTP